MKPNDAGEEKEPIFDPYAEFALDSYKALLKDRTVLLNSDITDSVIERVVLPIITLSQKNSKPIKLLINSNGGSIEAGQAVVDCILTSKAPIVTIALGKAMSAAFDIFLSGNLRIVYPNTILMCHSGSTVLERQTLPQVNQEAKLHEAYFLRWSKWYASRTKINEKEWLSLLNSGLNKYFFPEQALKDGLVHKIVPIPSMKNLKNLSKYKF